jgi:acyl-CoA thioester hydrolase
MTADPGGKGDDRQATAQTPGWRHPMPLRFRDLDYLGHVTAAEYLAMFEEGRAAWLSVKFDTSMPTYVVARQEIDFKRELRLHEGPVTLTIELLRIGHRSLDIEESLESASGTVHALSRATLVMWDMDTRGSRDFTASERTALEPDAAESQL